MFNTFFFSESPAVYKIMWRKYCRAGYASDDNKSMRFTSWIPKDKSTQL